MQQVMSDVIGLSDFAYERLRTRLDGLTDEEYFWEPAPNSWSIRPNGDGSFRGDWGVMFDETPPVTTIAWRIGHLIDCLTGERCATWLDLEPKPSPVAGGLPRSAEEARAKLDAAYAIWKSYLTEVDPEGLRDVSGPVAGMYAAYTRFSFVIHIIDELIHHGAEVGVLRDLYRARQEDPFLTAVFSGDRGAVEELQTSDPNLVSVKREQLPDLMRIAAATARWKAIPLLADLGFAVNSTTTRTALHHAAGAGNLDVVKQLIALGADTNIKDPTYNTTPLGWAEYFNRTEIVEYLRPLTNA